MQALEGEEQTVETMYSKVEKGPRHFGMTQVRWERLKERRFLTGPWALRIFGMSTFGRHPVTASS
jgi:hypothetical protein